VTLADDPIANGLSHRKGAGLLGFGLDPTAAKLWVWRGEKGRTSCGNRVCVIFGCRRCRSYPAEFLFDVGHCGLPSFDGGPKNSGNYWVHFLVFG
jgi:hypothetical protein